MANANFKKENIEKTIKEVLADRLDIDIKKVKNDLTLSGDLGMDSFGAVELIFELKDKFGIEIPQEDFVTIKKVKDIIEYISSRIT
jgi:acyl carrier protein